MYVSQPVTHLEQEVRAETEDYGLSQARIPGEA